MQRATILIFCALTVVVPLFTPDLYPFTAMPMFSDKLDEFSYFEVYLPDGSETDPGGFGLQSNYIANRHAKLSTPPPTTLETGNAIVDDSILNAHLLPYFKTQQIIRWIRVDQKILGTLPASKTGAVGVIKEHSWKIQNPYFSESESHG